MPNPGPLILFSRENLDITYISYKVADSLETAEFLSDVWREFLKAKRQSTMSWLLMKKMDSRSIKICLGICYGKSYTLPRRKEQRLIDAEYFRNPILGSKCWTNWFQVILTVRESDEIWWKSWSQFMVQACGLYMTFDFSLLNNYDYIEAI